MSLLHPDRLLPTEPETRAIARRLYASVRDLPIVSPHGHTDPRWYALDEAFPDPATLFIKPDHYIFRMLYSQGVPLERLGVRRKDGAPVETDNRKIWSLFASHLRLFRGTPTRLWLEQSLEDVFGVSERLTEGNADRIYDAIAEKLASPSMRPRALYERFRIEVISTTDSPLDDLAFHDRTRASGWKGRVIPAYRPDSVVDPEFEGFHANLSRFGEITGEDAHSWRGYLAAHRARRADFIARGATSSDHGHVSARTANLAPNEAEALFARVAAGPVSAEDADLFRGQMLTEMAKMSIDDGLVLQIHPARSAITMRACSHRSAATWAPTFRLEPTMCAR